jgi:hypothetical protein
MDMTSHFSKNGGNALGISAADGPLNRLSPFLFPSIPFHQLTFKSYQYRGIVVQ